MCEDKSLLTFIDFVTHPRKVIYLLLSLIETEDERKATLCFLVVPYKNAFSSVLGRFFLVTLDVVASDIHLKVTYHNNARKPIVLNDKLRTKRHICNDILRNLLATTTVLEEALRELDMVELNVRGDKILLVPNEDFEFVQLDDNPTRLVKIGGELPCMVNNALITCLRDNPKLFCIYPHEMPNIDLTMTCHKLNLDPNARYVSQ